jgi:DNA-binding NarL/FixJ family response regulator
VSKLRVLVADDHEVVRAGVRSVLENETDCEVCGEAATGRQAVTLAAQLKPDIVVLDITMPELNGLEAARQIRKALPGVPILILSLHESLELVREILDAGAHGYVLKSNAGHELTTALRALRQGETFFTSEMAQAALRACLKKEDADVMLTAREREVLQKLVEGESNKETAAILNISVLTVETHRANIMQKLGLHSIAELVHYAVRHKIIRP